MDFDEHESDWFKANVELMISRLKDDEWAEQGLPITPAVDTGASRPSAARGRIIAQACAGNAVAVDAAAAKAACAGALRSHKHTHVHSSLTLPAKAFSLHARAHSLSPRAHAQSVWGGAGLQVLNVASRRTRTQKVILILMILMILMWRFRKVPSTLCMCVVLPCSQICNHLAYIAYLTYILYFAYFAYCLYAAYCL